MRFYRKDRVGSVIQKELGQLLLREVETPPGVLLTITSVEVQKDLEIAHIYVSVLPSERGRDLIKILHHAQKHLQFLLLRKLNIKPMPELFFKLDHGLENAARVEKALLSDHNSEV